MFYKYQPDGQKFKKAAPCPCCQRYINWGELACFHCGYQLTEQDIENLKAHIEQHHQSGFKFGIKMWLLVCVLLFMLAFEYLNNAS